MHVQTALISWHELNAVMSLDLRVLADGRTVVATAGAESNVRVERDSVKVEYLATLSAHTKGVNVVKIGPHEEEMHIASAGDDHQIKIWIKKDGEVAEPEFGATEGVLDKETWVVKTSLRGHLADVYDLQWSPCGKYIISGSIDNSVIVWDVAKNKMMFQFKDHEKFVQGVSWDPLQQYLVSLSCDRNMVVYKRKFTKKKKPTVSKFKVIKKVKVQSLGDEEDEIRFVDDSYPIYFRRMAWSPDGSLCVVPSATSALCKPHNHCALVFRREQFETPVHICGGFEYPVVAVRFSTVQYGEQRGSGPRFVYAVASTKELAIYDTEQETPIALIRNIHCAQITDLAWSNNGMTLGVCSTDGYCSFVTFHDDELGPRRYGPQNQIPSFLEAPVRLEKLEKESKPEPVGVEEIDRAASPVPLETKSNKAASMDITAFLSPKSNTKKIALTRVD